MIELNEQQCQELASHEPALAHDPKTDETYVLVRKEMYDRLRTLMNEERVYTTADNLDRVMAENDANDPHPVELKAAASAVTRYCGSLRWTRDSEELHTYLNDPDESSWSSRDV